MGINRRQILSAGAALLVSGWNLPQLARAAESAAVVALDKSRLIYLTPVVSGGKASKCHGEVWFVHHKSEVFVSTQTSAWRAEAIRRGFSSAKIWIGEFGVWKRAENRYLSAPFLRLEGKLETDAALNEEVLTQFGKKYSKEWSSWGPRFRDGLADGSRVMLRYRVAS